MKKCGRKTHTRSLKLFKDGKFLGYGMKYQCAFCGEKFDKASDCAKHIEEKSIFGTCWPPDIVVVPKKKVSLDEGDER
jgi:predicted restriction endonuclease